MVAFSEKIFSKINEIQNPSVVGLDPRVDNLPRCVFDEDPEKLDNEEKLKVLAAGIERFNKEIIESVEGIVGIIKPNAAFYEVLGEYGMKALKETCKFAKKKGFIVIADGKRNDIGSTAEAYAKGWFGELGFGKYVDAMTINPYLGFDTIKPFVPYLKERGKGLFVLVKTSNPSSKDFQDLEVKIKEGDETKKLYKIVAERTNEWIEAEELKGEDDYSSVGAVVGATYPEELAMLREKMPHSIFLIPGYGFQGGKAEDVALGFDENGKGALINSSRGIIYAYQKLNLPEEKFGEAAKIAATNMRKDILSALEKHNKLPEGWKI